jgi:hypothetical protein
VEEKEKSQSAKLKDKHGRNDRLRKSARKPRNKIDSEAGYLWLTPVILATWEAEIRRFKIQSQFRQIVCETPSQK